MLQETSIHKSSSDVDVHVEGYCIIDAECMQHSVAQAGVCSVCKVGKYYLKISVITIMCRYVCAYICACVACMYGSPV